MASNVTRISSGALIKRAAEKSGFLRQIKKVDPTDRYVVIFPDARNVRVGIGFNLLNVAASERVYLKASEILNTNFLKLCLEGPEDRLCGSFVNKSLAAFVTSCAVVAKLRHERPQVIPLITSAAGVGVGIINALEFSDSMTFEDAFELVRRRAEAVERASQIVPSKAIRVQLRPATSITKVCRAAQEHCQSLDIPVEIAVCSAKAKFCSNIIEFGGHSAAIEFLEAEGPRLFGFRKVITVTSDNPAYNTELMRPAKQFLKLFIEQKCKENPDYIREPTKSIYASIDGKRVRKLPDLKTMIHKELTQPSKVESLFQTLFLRSKDVAQPNILSLWDKFLLNDLRKVNRKAHASAKFLCA